MRGEIELESELGRGTTTTFWLPFNKTRLKISKSPPVNPGPTTRAQQRDSMESDCAPGLQIGSGNVGSEISQSRRRSILGVGLDPLPFEPVAEDSFASEIDRKSVHVLVVEDK